MEEVVEDDGERRFLVKPRMVTWAKNVFGTEEDLRAGMERVGLQWLQDYRGQSAACAGLR